MKEDNMQQQDDQAGETILNMPEVRDIPGQENVVPPRMREMEDVTISSADEEGDGILDDLNGPADDLLTDEESNVSSPERHALAQAGRPDNDERIDVRRSTLDDRDEDGEKLNEQTDPRDFGSDLDVPGADMDDDAEDMGSEDEENNPYTVNKQ